MTTPSSAPSSQISGFQLIDSVFNSLRTELENNVCNSGKLSKHIELIENLMGCYSHTIRPYADVLVSNADIDYNCYKYALGLTNSTDIERISNKHLDAWDARVGTEFVFHLIDKGIVSPQQDGKIIVYFMDDMPQHAGKVVGDRVRSKWGLGHLWEHAIGEVPSSYGKNYRLFGLVDTPVIISEFKDWHRTMADCREC